MLSRHDDLAQRFPLLEIKRRLEPAVEHARAGDTITGRSFFVCGGLVVVVNDQDPYIVGLFEGQELPEDWCDILGGVFVYPGSHQVERIEYHKGGSNFLYGLSKELHIVFICQVELTIVHEVDGKICGRSYGDLLAVVIDGSTEGP